MSFTSAWDETKPAGSRNLNLGDDDIRELKQQVQERADIDGYFPSADDSKTGYHRKTTLIEQASDPAQVADTLILYSKLVGSYSELHSRHENAALQQLTLNGKLWIEALTIASIAQGDIFYYDGTKVTRLGPGTSGYFLKTQGAAANPVWAALSGSFIGGNFRNLAVASTGNATLSLTADEVLVDDGAGAVQRFTSVSLTADMAVSGAGGLSTGTEAANTIYYVWLVAKADGTKALIIDPSATSPTLPATYTYRTLLSCVGNNNSSNFIGFKQNGRRYNFTTWGTMASGNAGASWVAIDLTPANMSTNAGFVPSAISNYCYGSFRTVNIAAMTNDSSVSTGSTGAPNKYYNDSGGGAGKAERFEFDVLTSDTLYWLSNEADAVVYLHGFELNKIG